MKTNLVTVLSDTNFLPFLEFLKTLKLCFRLVLSARLKKFYCINFSHSNSYCACLLFNFYLKLCKCTLFGVQIITRARVWFEDGVWKIFLELFIWLSVFIKKSLLCNHGRRCIDRGNHKVCVRNIQHTKYGITGKIESAI